MSKYDKSDHFQDALFKPASDWKLPTSLPDLTNVDVIGLDIESRDPKLRESGPGFIRGDAEVIGISIATSDSAWYLPIKHAGGGNMDRGVVTRFVQDLVSSPNRLIVGANLQYDIEGLDSLGIKIAGPVFDIQVTEALIDEESVGGFSLDVLSKKYLNIGKDETLLRQAADAYGVDPKSGLWKLPSKYVGPYACWDAMSGIRIREEQLKTVASEDLHEILALESKLLPILFKMRRQGIRMNLEAASKLSIRLKEEEDALRLKMFKQYGCHVDEWSSMMIASLCDRLKLTYPRTLKGNPSFTGDFLDEAITVPLFCDISDLRELSRLRSTFVDSWIFGNQVKGRIHPVWRQIASDEGGTRTGRMAASNPNPQQIPAGKYRKTGKPNEIGKLIRSCFIPDEGLRWAKFDYSQQEPRILTHFAAVCDFTGAKLARMAYINDRKFDVYNYMVEAAGIDRRPAKDCYLGRCYGMGKKKLARKLGVTEVEAERILARFDEGVPFVKEIAESAMKTAASRGYIKTLCGRHRHFNFWEPINSYKRNQEGDNVISLPLEAAKQKYPGDKLQRSNTHKALNALIQGSAADMTKAAMIKCHEQLGIIPYMQVHDELSFGVRDEAHAKQVQDIIENCVNMTVPIVSDLSLGDHWK
jgi:DNA polymerase I-like protein with 3'-5' exonuclease and polymerase domains